MVPGSWVGDASDEDFSARTSLRLGRGGGTERRTGRGGVTVAVGWAGGRGGGSLRCSITGLCSAGGAVCAALFAFSLSPSPQLVARSPRALAIPHSVLRLGGTGGFSPAEDVAIVAGS